MDLVESLIVFVGFWWAAFGVFGLFYLVGKALSRRTRAQPPPLTVNEPAWVPPERPSVPIPPPFRGTFEGEDNGGLVEREADDGGHDLDDDADDDDEDRDDGTVDDDDAEGEADCGHDHDDHDDDDGDEDDDDLRVSPPPPRRAPPQIVTRTNVADDAVALIDPYVDREREWSRAEDRHILELFDEGWRVNQIAEYSRFDQRQVAIRLVRLIFGVEGDVDAGETAERHGRKYSKEERAGIRRDFLLGVPLVEIAERHGRTPLGAGWMLLNSRPQVVFVPDEVRRRYGMGT